MVAGVLLTQGGGFAASASVQANSVGVINPASGHVLAAVSVGTAPGDVVAGSGAIWVANTDDDTVSRIGASSNNVDQTIQVGGEPADVAVGGGAVWVTNGLDGTVSRINPDVNQGQVVCKRSASATDLSAPTARERFG